MKIHRADGRHVQLRNAQGACFDVIGKVQPDAKFILWRCKNAFARNQYQFFLPEQLGPNNKVMLRLQKHRGYCAEATRDGFRVAHCKRSQEAQRFTVPTELYTRAVPPGYIFEMKNRHGKCPNHGCTGYTLAAASHGAEIQIQMTSGECLNVRGANYQENAQIDAWHCQHPREFVENQMWLMERLEQGTLLHSSGNSQLCLALRPSWDGRQLILAKCSHEDNTQVWTLPQALLKKALPAGSVK